MTSIAERMAQWVTETGATAALERNGDTVTEALPVTDLVVSDGRATGKVTFGPYSESVRAQGVRIGVAGGFDTKGFDTELNLPAGMTFLYEVAIEVTDA